MHLLYIVFAVAAGFLVAFQPGVNMSMRKVLEGSAGTSLSAGFQAAVVSFSGGVLCALIATLVMRAPLPRASSLVQHAPWYAWTGGLIGFILVTTSLLLAGRITAGTLIGAILLGQIVGSIAIDWFGLVGFSVARENFGWRLLGTLFLLAGLAIIYKANPRG